MSSAFSWVTPETIEFMERDYLIPGQTVEQRVAEIAKRAGDILGIEWFADVFTEYMAAGYYSLSTPIWSNFGTDRGLPISCFGTFMEDSMESILQAQAEIGMMSKFGGGTSCYVGNLRPRGADIRNNGKSSGSVHFVPLFESVTGVVSQGGMRRGNCAVYQDIDHPDIMEFLTMRSEGSPIQDINFGVNVSDTFMQRMIDGDQDARKVWARVLTVRANTGYPYIFWVDTANRNSPYLEINERQAQLGLGTPHRIKHSNLCSEIMLPNSSVESFVCDLASMNVLKFDSWKDTQAVKILTFFLDAVMTEFIEKAEQVPFLERAARFGRRHRALGIGWLGWHSYLQSKMVSWESFEAKMLNIQVAQHIKQDAYSASEELAQKYGVPAALAVAGINRRNTTLTAIAPTKSSAFILGQVSEGIEPHRSNYFVKDLAKGKFTMKNPHLKALLQTKDADTEETWERIKQTGGSVQGLEFLSDHERDVFKTFSEISPKEVIIQAAARQQHIDQGQSLNLLIHPDVSVRDVNRLMIFAWEQGVKSLYYQYSVNAAQDFAKNILECTSCSA